MRAQLDHLAEAAALPNVVIRVLPFGIGAHPAMSRGAFNVLEFPDPADSHIAYTAQPTSSIDHSLALQIHRGLPFRSGVVSMMARKPVGRQDPFRCL